MIEISKLPLIKTPEEFFSVDKVLFVDVVEVKGIIDGLKDRLVNDYNGFRHKGRVYLPLFLKGSPEILIKNAKRNIPQRINNWFTLSVCFDGDLLHAIHWKKLYDFSEHYKQNSPLDFKNETSLLLERYVLPFLK